MSTPAGWTEVDSLLKKSGQVTLNSSGQATLTFDPDNARQRWQVTSVVVTTNQAANAVVVPVVTLAVNAATVATMSPGQQRGSTWSGNQDTWEGLITVGPCDFLSVLFAPPSGASPTPLSGVIATAIITGTKHTRRA